MATTPVAAAMTATPATGAMATATAGSSCRLRSHRRNACSGGDQQCDQRFPRHDCLQISTLVGLSESRSVRQRVHPTKRFSAQRR
jgi:hypothetical protein